MKPALARGLSPTRTAFDNGSVVIVQETPTTPAVTMLATFLGGSLYEPGELPGLAYLTGQLLDRGTVHRPAERIAEELDERGVALHVATTRHTLSLACTCLAEDFDQVLAILVDVARRPVFEELEIAKRRAEVVTSLRQDEDNPAVRATEKLFEMLYGAAHPYGRRPKGTIASVERIARRDLVSFHHSRFLPGTLTLTLVGDVSTAHALERAAHELEDWRGDATGDISVPPPGGAVSRQVQAIDIPGKAQSDIAYGFTAMPRLDPRYYACWVMNNILGQFGLGGRLADNIRERQGMAYYAFSAFDPSVGAGPLLVRAGVDPRNVDRTIDAIDHEVGKLGAEGATPGELQESRQYLVGSIARMLETNHGIAVFLQNAEQFGLGLDYDQQLPRHLRGVSLDEVNAVAAGLLRPDRAAVAVAGPDTSISERV
jgi:zinc protease